MIVDDRRRGCKLLTVLLSLTQRGVTGMPQLQNYLQYRNDTRLQIERAGSVIRIKVPAQGFVRAAEHQVRSLIFWLIVACAGFGGCARQLSRWCRSIFESQAMPHVDPWDVAVCLASPATFALVMLAIRGGEHAILTLEEDQLISTGSRSYREARSGIREVTLDSWGVCIILDRKRRLLPGSARRLVLAFHPRADQEHVAMILRDWLAAGNR